MHLPLEFISFGITEGKMFTHWRKKDTFVAEHNEELVKPHGNNVVYGGLFFCPDIQFYLPILDAYHVCSMSTLGKNHIKDYHHRKEKNIIPIYFNSLDELSRLKYREGKPIIAHTYVGNTHHPKIIPRINKYEISYRLVDGMEKENFKALFREVNG